MSRIEWAPEVGEDFERILDQLAQYDVDDGPARVQGIIQAIAVLEQNPLIGRPVQGGKRELVIGRRSHGHVALYRYVDKIDSVFPIALRSQREAGYARA